MDIVEVSSMSDIPDYCLSIPKVSVLLGITPEALTYRVKENTNNIHKYVIKIVFVKTKKFRFFIKHSFLNEALKEEKTKLTKEEKVEIEMWYYILLEQIEEKLLLENKSVATQTQLWGDMPLVDMILCGKIFKFHKEKGTVLTPYLKKELRRGIRYLDFTNVAAGEVALKAMKYIGKENG